jgi:hypothetical protein
LTEFHIRISSELISQRARRSKGAKPAQKSPAEEKRGPSVRRGIGAAFPGCWTLSRRHLSDVARREHLPVDVGKSAYRGSSARLFNSAISARSRRMSVGRMLPDRRFDCPRSNPTIQHAVPLLTDLAPCHPGADRPQPLRRSDDALRGVDAGQARYVPCTRISSAAGADVLLSRWPGERVVDILLRSNRRRLTARTTIEIDEIVAGNEQYVGQVIRSPSRRCCAGRW